MSRIQRELQEAESTDMLHLCNTTIQHIPQDTFKLTNLIRLDVGYNNLTSIPHEIGSLPFLEELWANNNPLHTISQNIYQCKRLHTIDLRDTTLKMLPWELGRLENMRVIHLAGTKEYMQEDIRASYEHGTPTLIEYLRYMDNAQRLQTTLEEKFRDGVYLEISNTSEGIEKIHHLATLVLSEFQDHDDVKNVIRNCDRLFPHDIRKVNVPHIKKKFNLLKEQNMKKKLAANLELRLRNLYFDRINPALVEPMVKSIYSKIDSLADIQFIIRYAPTVFPSNSEDVTALLVYDNMKQLQAKIAAERAQAIAAVEKSLRLLYPHMEPNLIRQLNEAVCKYFAKIEDLKKLAADSSVYFPAEFETAMTEPKGIRSYFVEVARESKNNGDLIENTL